MVLCLLSCVAVGGLGALAEGTQVQLTSADLSAVLATATIEAGTLDFDTELEPLTNVVLLISNATNELKAQAQTSPETAPEMITLSGFVSASGSDIMVQEPEETVSLKDYLQTLQVVLDLGP